LKIFVKNIFPLYVKPVNKAEFIGFLIYSIGLECYCAVTISSVCKPIPAYGNRKFWYFDRWIVEMQVTPEEKYQRFGNSGYFKVSRTPIRGNSENAGNAEWICTYRVKATVVASLALKTRTMVSPHADSAMSCCKAGR
jgi:hypothetical protein